ncbi:MAG: bifunctional nuclease family protein [Balneolaceae bacterium]
MSRVEMEILGLSTSPGSGGAYALILTELDGDRRLPIIIGTFEAQAIALELEQIKPPRPMTHDLIRNVILSFDSVVREVYINHLSEGTFFARVFLDKGTDNLELDARPSDAIALAIRFGAPILVDETVLEKAGLTAGEPIDGSEETAADSSGKETTTASREMSEMEKLERDLKAAIDTENYEKAARLRDQINKMKS